MKIEMLSPSELIPYKNNPRKNEQAVDKVATSISEFGFKQPIVVDKDNIIVVGHTRWKAALKLGLKEVPVIRATDLTPAKLRAYRIADNKTNEFAEWDWEGLGIELDELNDLDIDLDWLEFDDSVKKPIKKTINTSQYNQNYILIVFSPDLFIEISGKLEELSNIEGVQIYQGVN